MDENFRSAYQEFADDPSPSVWEKINAGLDKKDAESYRKRSGTWKKVAIVSLLLLVGLILYESGILKTSFSHSKENMPITDGGKKPEKNPEKQHETINDRNHFLPGKSNKEEPISVKEKISRKIEGNTRKIAFLHKNILPDLPVKTEKQEATVTSSIAEYKKELLKKDQHSLVGKITVPSVEENQMNDMVAQQLSHTGPAHLEITNDSFSIHNNVKNNTTITINHFKPYWTISGYMCTDRVGYRLDKDFPTITQIRQREEHEPSFSGGILVTRQFKERWSLQSGLIYSNTSIAIQPQKIYASQNQAGTISYKYLTSSGYAYIKPGFGPPPSPGDSLATESAQHSLQHIIVPLIISYSIIKHNKFIFSTGFGISGNFLMSAKIETDVEDAFNREHVLINKLNGIRSFYWAAMAEAKAQYIVSKKVSVNLHPSFRYALSAITKNNDVDTFPYTFGLGVEVSYRF